LGSLQVYIQAYLYLKDIVQYYYNSSTTLYLQESSKPIGRYQAAINQEKELSKLIQNNTEFIQKQENQEFVNSIEDLLILERKNPSIFQDIENNSITAKDVCIYIIAAHSYCRLGRDRLGM
jgi:hypothetical protein